MGCVATLKELERAGTVVSARSLEDKQRAARPLDVGPWRGRVGELVGVSRSAQVTTALALLWSAQREGDPVAWVRSTPDGFFAPDAQALGLDLGALTVVRAPDSAQAARAAGLLLRSGALGALVLDLGEPSAVSAGAWARLRAWAERHEAALVVLTPPGARLDALVSWRANTARVVAGEGERAVVMEVVRDKLGRARGRVEVSRARVEAYA